MSKEHEVVVAAGDSKQRLDAFLVRAMPGWSRSQLQRLIRAGHVTVQGRPARKSGQEVEAGQRIAVEAVHEEPRVAPEALSLDILYEDADLLVVNKPAGMVMHVGAGIQSGTLVNALLYHLGGAERLSAAGGALRPGIVHRLDKMTSGLVVVAKNDRAHRLLAAQFKAREVVKTYQLLVHGRVEKSQGVIARPVGRDPVRRVRMKAGGLRAREAATEYRVLRRFARFTYLEAHPRTGRTHQLRVHFASLGHPIAGDTLYGAPKEIERAGVRQPTLERNFLHAAGLEFRHPSSGERLSFQAPLPRELVDFARSLAPEAAPRK
jgi:23S rRNA pseudouridine1911/1915/1917 synthase